MKRSKIIYGVGVIAMIIGLLIGVPDLAENIIEYFQEPKDGVYGDTYKSYSGGFFVKTPSISWHFKTVEDIQEKLVKPMAREDLIDGIIIHSPRTDSILAVNVFLPTNDELKDLRKTVLGGFESAKPFFDHAKFIVVGNNPEGWVEFEGNRTTNDILTYTKFNLKIHNDKLYIIQSHLVHSASFNEKEEQDLNTAWDSFKFCLNEKNCDDLES